MSASTVRRTLLWTAVAAIVGTAAAVVVLLGQARQSERDLGEARVAASAGVEAARDGELDTAIAHLREARVPLGRARARQEGILWSLAGRVPFVAPSVHTLDAITDTGASGVDVAVATLTAAGDIVAARAPDDRIPLAAIERLGGVVDGQDVARLGRTRDGLTAPVSGPVPDALLEARTEVLEASDQLLATVASLRDTVTVARELLGADGPRHYLVAMQNSAELRGTGGLVGFHAVLTADRGRLSLAPPQSDEALDVPPDAVPALAPEARQWLGHANPAASLKTVNLDPDFTRTGPLLARVHEAGTGQRLDGVIAVDPVAVAALMRPGDEVVVPTGLVDPDHGLASHIAAADIPRTMLVDAYQVLGGSTDRRKAFHAFLAEAAFDELTGLALDAGLLDRLAFAVEGRHLQVYTRHTDAQAALRRLGVAGALAPSAPGDDLLAVTVNNAGGGKPDVHVRHAVDARVVVSPDSRTGSSDGAAAGVVTARRDVVVGFGLDNPLAPDAGWADYIVSTSLSDQPRSPSLTASNRSWVTVWGPAGTRVRGGPSTDGPVTGAAGTVGDLVVVDHLLATPPRSAGSYEIDLEGPVQLRATPDGLVYRLTLWHQAKAIADHVRIDVQGADGWEVVSGHVAGRSDAVRLGFGERAVPLRLEIADGVATIRGTAVGDVDVEVVLARSAS